MNALAYIDSRVWAILPRHLSQLRAAAMQTPAVDFDRMASALSGKSESDLPRYMSKRGGVAVIGVEGPLWTSGGIIDEIMAIVFGGTSTKALGMDIQRAVMDPSIDSILLNVNSPGGEAFGINEVARMVYAAREKKNVAAYINGLGASAAYWIASAATEVVADKVAWVGSIGVVAGWADFSEAYSKMGIAYEEVVSSNAPFKRLDIRKPEDRRVFMSEIDGVEKVFIDSVARFRGVSRDVVVGQFGQGAVMTGGPAAKAGMIDRTGSFDEVLRDLQLKKKRQMRALAAEPGAETENDMSFKEEVKNFAAKLGLRVQDEPAPAEDPEEAATSPAPPEQPHPTADPVDPESDSEKPGDAEAEETADYGEQQDNPAEAEETPAEAPETVEVAALRNDEPTDGEKIAALRSQLFSAEAESFAKAEVAAGRLTPAERGDCEKLYTKLAALGDNGAALADFKAMQSRRKPHGLNEEVVDAKANQVVLAGLAGEGSGSVSADRQKELLEKTHLGRSALKLVTSEKA